MRSHAQFGTAKWLPDETVARALEVDFAEVKWPASIDFVSARTEFYEEPSALPTVQRSSIKLDLHRRDFTINTLAIRLAPEPLGELLDFYGGEQDLHDGVIRVLHSLSFVDDATRMLRAVRLEQRLGFQIEPRTEELIRGARRAAGTGQRRPDPPRNTLDPGRGTATPHPGTPGTIRHSGGAAS